MSDEDDIFRCPECQRPLVISEIDGKITTNGNYPIALILGCTKCGTILNSRLLQNIDRPTMKDVKTSPVVEKVNVMKEQGFSAHQMWDNLDWWEREYLTQKAGIKANKPTLHKSWAVLTRTTQEKLEIIFEIDKEGD